MATNVLSFILVGSLRYYAVLPFKQISVVLVGVCVRSRLAENKKAPIANVLIRFLRGQYNGSAKNHIQISGFTLQIIVYEWHSHTHGMDTVYPHPFTLAKSATEKAEKKTHLTNMYNPMEREKDGNKK